MNDEYLKKIGLILDNLERRLSVAEAENAVLREVLTELCGTIETHDQSIVNLAERITHESLSIVDVINDMLAKLNPVYDRFNPSLGEFTDEVHRALRRRPSSG